MLLINLATIYQGTIPILRHTQAHAHQLSQIYLQYTLTGELDRNIKRIIKELRNTDTTHPWPTPTLHSSHTSPAPPRKSQRIGEKNNNTKALHPPPPTTRKRPLSELTPATVNPTQPTYNEPTSNKRKPGKSTHTNIHNDNTTTTKTATKLAHPKNNKTTANLYHKVFKYLKFKERNNFVYYIIKIIFAVD